MSSCIRRAPDHPRSLIILINPTTTGGYYTSYVFQFSWRTLQVFIVVGGLKTWHVVFLCLRSTSSSSSRPPRSMSGATQHVKIRRNALGLQCTKCFRLVQFYPQVTPVDAEKNWTKRSNEEFLRKRETNRLPA